MMKTISQVTELTGISARTLQYYDEIGLLKPSAFTPSGYRLYDDAALQQLQQILFFKELDFKLKDIKEIMETPDFNKEDAFKKQKKLLILKRNRLNNLITLLDKLEKGESCMSFKEFDLSEYIEALEQFKNQNEDKVIRHWGSMENFNSFIQKIKEDEPKVAQLAIKQYGSVEKYTAAMKYNLEHFSELMEQMETAAKNKEDILQKNDELHRKLLSDMKKSPDCEEIQSLLHELITFTQSTMPQMDMGKGYWDLVINGYSNNDTVRKITDQKYGDGASDYIAKAMRYYFTAHAFTAHRILVE